MVAEEGQRGYFECMKLSPVGYSCTSAQLSRCEDGRYSRVSEQLMSGGRRGRKGQVLGEQSHGQSVHSFEVTDVVKATILKL